MESENFNKSQGTDSERDPKDIMREHVIKGLKLAIEMKLSPAEMETIMKECTFMAMMEHFAEQLGVDI